MNVKFSEKSIKKELLLEADEIFLTNAVKGCQWVVGYKNRRYYNNISRKIIEMLNKKLLQNE
jgi:branched-chain amino acid aminotransferase